MATALRSISGAYGIVYGYVATDATAPWRIYAAGVPAWVNDLDSLEFGHGYWINMTQPITLHLRGADYGALDTAATTIPLPPATFYGRVESGSRFTPAPGMTLTAGIDGHLCGQTELTDVAGYGVAYAVDVMADDGAYPGCGAAGREVTFQVDGQAMAATAAWNNDWVWELALEPHYRVYAPLVMRAHVADLAGGTVTPASRKVIGIAF